MNYKEELKDLIKIIDSNPERKKVEDVSNVVLSITSSDDPNVWQAGKTAKEQLEILDKPALYQVAKKVLSSEDKFKGKRGQSSKFREIIDDLGWFCFNYERDEENH